MRNNSRLLLPVDNAIYSIHPQIGGDSGRTISLTWLSRTHLYNGRYGMKDMLKML